MSMFLSERNEFVGGHVTPEVKKAMVAESRKSGESMSKILEAAIIAELRRRGYKLKEGSYATKQTG